MPPEARPVAETAFAPVNAIDAVAAVLNADESQSQFPSGDER